MSWLIEARNVLWLALPVMFAAAVHIAVLRLKLLESWKTPMDFGGTLRGQRLFGDNKTWRGAVVYVLGTVIGILPQGFLIRMEEWEYFDYGDPTTLLLAGLLLGLGWVLGELPNSFLKRQRGIGPGQRAGALHVLLDQVDSLIGCLALLCFVWVAPPRVWIATLVLCSGVHMLFNSVFVLVGLKKSIF